MRYFKEMITEHGDDGRAGGALSGARWARRVIPRECAGVAGRRRGRGGRAGRPPVISVSRRAPPPPWATSIPGPTLHTNRGRTSIGSQQVTPRLAQPPPGPAHSNIMLFITLARHNKTNRASRPSRHPSQPVSVLSNVSE